MHSSWEISCRAHQLSCFDLPTFLVSSASHFTIHLHPSCSVWCCVWLNQWNVMVRIIFLLISLVLEKKKLDNEWANQPTTKLLSKWNIDLLIWKLNFSANTENITFLLYITYYIYNWAQPWLPSLSHYPGISWFGFLPCHLVSAAILLTAMPREIHFFSPKSLNCPLNMCSLSQV